MTTSFHKFHRSAGKFPQETTFTGASKILWHVHTVKHTPRRGRERASVASAQAGPTIADVVFPEQLNHRGTLFGGAAIALMDRAAFVAASREARTDVVCAGADGIEFSQPIAPGDLVEAT